MGSQQSKKDELLYQQVTNGDTEVIKKLHSEGAGLEWIDKEGMTPLILASMHPHLYDVAKTLIELGANVNAYHPGPHAGSALHHAAKGGLEQLVKLLLSHGANALVMNDDGQTALDLARVNGYINVVRAIENHICLFSGWLQLCHLIGPFDQLNTQNVWVVILPCGASSLTTPLKLELAIYSSLEVAKPRALFPLWKANMDEPNYFQDYPTVVITDYESHMELAAVNENENQDLQQFCNACKGYPQDMHAAFPFDSLTYYVGPSIQNEQCSSAVGLTAHVSGSTTSRGWINPATYYSDHSEMTQWEIQDVGASSTPVSYYPHLDNNTYPQFAPSAPPLPDFVDDGTVVYPSIDTTPIYPSEREKNNNESSSCVICLDAPVEGACIPCGHMAGCMSCLNEIKGKSWGCPVCIAKIDQVVRVYAV